MSWKALSMVALVAAVSSCGECEQEVRARPYDVQRGCFGEPQRVGCIARDRACPPTITVAVDASGRCFAFPGCLADGFTRAEPGSGCPSAGASDCASTTAALASRPSPSSGVRDHCIGSRRRR